MFVLRPDAILSRPCEGFKETSGECNYNVRTPGGHDWRSQSGRQGEPLMPSDMAHIDTKALL